MTQRRNSDSKYSKEQLMSDMYVLDDHGQPLRCDDLFVWAEWFEGSGEKRVVAQDAVGDVRVSTVFLGLDHHWGFGGPPVLWETMIVGGPHDGYEERYSSREDARAGHAYALELASVTRSIECEPMSRRRGGL